MRIGLAGGGNPRLDPVSDDDLANSLDDVFDILFGHLGITGQRYQALERQEKRQRQALIS